MYVACGLSHCLGMMVCAGCTRARDPIKGDSLQFSKKRSWTLAKNREVEAVNESV